MLRSPDDPEDDPRPQLAELENVAPVEDVRSDLETRLAGAAGERCDSAARER